MNENTKNTNNTITICTCDSNGVHYPCSICGKYYDDELEALLCCIEFDLNLSKKEKHQICSDAFLTTGELSFTRRHFEFS